MYRMSCSLLFVLMSSCISYKLGGGYVKRDEVDFPFPRNDITSIFYNDLYEEPTVLREAVESEEEENENDIDEDFYKPMTYLGQEQVVDIPLGTPDEV